jgi:two-component system cell cycle sensor histidine kinase/response regulator CckA
MSESRSSKLNPAQRLAISTFIRAHRQPILQACETSLRVAEKRHTAKEGEILKFHIPILLDLLAASSPGTAGMPRNERRGAVPLEALFDRHAAKMSQAVALEGEMLLKAVLDRFIDEHFEAAEGKKAEYKRYVGTKMEEWSRLMNKAVVPIRSSVRRQTPALPKTMKGKAGARDEKRSVSRENRDNVGEVAQVEKELELLRESYAGLLDFVLDPVLLIDCCREGRIVDANREAQKLTGYARDRLCGTLLPDLATEEDVGKLDGQLREAARTGILPETEFRLKGPDRKEIKITLSPSEQQGSHNGLLICRLLPLAQRQGEPADDSMEKTMFNQAARYRKMFASSIDGLFLGNGDGEIQEINLSATRMLGFDTIDDAIGTGILNSFFSEERDRMRFLGEMNNRGFVKDFEFEMKNRKGQSFILLISCTAIKHPDGRIIEYQGMVKDITEYKALERQLYQAQKMETIGALGSGIAHDFNNILAFILPNVQMMKMIPGLPEQCLEYADNIENAARKAARLTEQLLSFSRKGETNRVVLSINSRIKEIIRLLSRSIDKRIRIEPRLDSNLDNVEADVAQIDQVVLNLALNARDAMENGGVLTFVTENRMLEPSFCAKHPGTEPGRYVYFSVRDTGTGIKGEHMEKIFDPFFTTKEPGKGTGLGLSVAYSIVKTHGGTIFAESSTETGTEFHVYIPATKKPCSIESVRNISDVMAGTETVLLVDDEQSILKLIGKVLQYLGYRVLTAENGQEAVQIFRDHSDKIDLVILDMHMPFQSGYATFAELRALNPKIPVILSSGYDERAKLEQTIKQGRATFIQKPYDIAYLSREIRRILGS